MDIRSSELSNSSKRIGGAQEWGGGSDLLNSLMRGHEALSNDQQANSGNDLASAAQVRDYISQISGVSLPGAKQDFVV